MAVGPLLAKAALATGAGIAIGVFLWLWQSRGAEVYLNYLAGVAMTCF